MIRSLLQSSSLSRRQIAKTTICNTTNTPTTATTTSFYQQCNKDNRNICQDVLVLRKYYTRIRSTSSTTGTASILVQVPTIVRNDCLTFDSIRRYDENINNCGQNNRNYNRNHINSYQYRCISTERTTTTNETEEKNTQKLITLQSLQETYNNTKNNNTANNEWFNVTEAIVSKINHKLHLQQYHPLNRIYQRIVQHFQKLQQSKNNNTSAADIVINANPDIDNNTNNTNNNTDKRKLHVFNNLHPIVSTYDNFDSLNTPIDHVSRSKSDTYYLNSHTVLRCHTSAHQVYLLQNGYTNFLVAGDVYRRDEIDCTHYPIFHQMEGIYIQSKQQWLNSSVNTASSNDNNIDELVTNIIIKDLQSTLESLVYELFGTNIQVRWIDAYFPFTQPSYELEIYYNNQWLEVLGCGIIHQQVLVNSNKNNEIGWAFGLGLERLAMVLYNIPDIRLFWTNDPRFHNQFLPKQQHQQQLPYNTDIISTEYNRSITFQPYSKYPACYKDISFWILNDNNNDNSEETNHSNNSTTIEKRKKQPFHVNDFNELVRNVCCTTITTDTDSTTSDHDAASTTTTSTNTDWIEEVKLIDEFVNPKTKLVSQCYRILYRSMDKVLTNEEIDTIQNIIRTKLEEQFNIQLR